MSPRRLDLRTRTALIEIGARLLAEEGPQALTTRRIAAEAGSSTMAVYTYFGALSGLVQAMVYEGFERLQHYFTHVRQTDDPVADLTLLGRAYRFNAQHNSHLYAAMFGGVSLGGFELSDEDRQHGRYTLAHVIECTGRCIDAGRFHAADPELVAHQMWIALHGLITLDLGAYLIPPYDADRVFEAQLIGLMTMSGDATDAATESVAASKRRFRSEVEQVGGFTAEGIRETAGG